MKNYCAWGICVAVLLVAVAMRTTAAEAQQGTPNFIAKFGAAALPNANSIMFDDGKNVGIGTTTPGARLHINSPDNDALKVTNTAVGKTLRIGVDQLGAWLEPTEQNSSIRLNANPLLVGLFINGQTGNIGIGTTAPATSLQIGNTGSFVQDARVTTATGNGAAFRSWSFGTNYGGVTTTSPNYGFTPSATKPLVSSVW
jgi:hypothetical protein